MSEQSGLCARGDAVNVVRPAFLSGWEPRGPQTHFSDPEPTRFPSTPGCRGLSFASPRVVLCVGTPWRAAPVSIEGACQLVGTRGEAALGAQVHGPRPGILELGPVGQDAHPPRRPFHVLQVGPWPSVRLGPRRAGIGHRPHKGGLGAVCRAGVPSRAFASAADSVMSSCLFLQTALWFENLVTRFRPLPEGGDEGSGPCPLPGR